MSAWCSCQHADVVDSVMGRLHACGGQLMQWNKEFFGNVSVEIAKLKKILKSLKDAPSRRTILQQIRELRNKEEILWWQRARSDYLKYGDANTCWFPYRANIRRSRNHIDYLVDNNGVKRSDPNDMEHIIVQYFSNLFSSSAPLAMDEVLSSVCPRVTLDMNETLCQPYTKLEIETALFQMHPHKAPGPDGMNPYFFQKFWDILDNEVSAAVLAILDGHPIPPKLNHTLVALIPKKPRLALFGISPNQSLQRRLQACHEGHF